MGHKQLTQTQREILARLKAQNVSVRKIAGILGYAPSSISRELRTNREKNGTYQADKAQRRAEWRIRKDKKADAYDGALSWCQENGILPTSVKAEQFVESLPEAHFEQTNDFTRRGAYAAYKK